MLQSLQNEGKSTNTAAEVRAGVSSDRSVMYLEAEWVLVGLTIYDRILDEGLGGVLFDSGEMMLFKRGRC